MQFVTANKEKTKTRLALTGPSGSGKTYTALKVAENLGGTIGVIDTENGTAAEYSGSFQFQHLVMRTYAPQELIKAVAVANKSGIGVLILDTWSKFWSGAGGMLEQVDARTKNGNTFGTGWREMRPVENQMIEALTSYPGHVIVTMRAKTAYEIQTNSNGKKEPVKLGTKPEQREGVEYEFSIVGDMDMQHTLTVTKSRAPSLDGAVIPIPGEEFAGRILEWVNEGLEVPDANTYRDRVLSAEATHEELKEIYGEVKRRGLSSAAVIDPATDEAVSLLSLIQRVGREKSRASG